MMSGGSLQQFVVRIFFPLAVVALMKLEQRATPQTPKEFGDE